MWSRKNPEISKTSLSVVSDGDDDDDEDYYTIISDAWLSYYLCEEWISVNEWIENILNLSIQYL